MSRTEATPPAALGDPSRLAALRGTRLLDSLPEESFDRLTRLAARVISAPVALVSLVDENRQFFKSCLGLPEPWASGRETPLSHSFCQYVVAHDEPLVVSDAREHPLLRGNLAIRDLNVVAYAGWPVHAADGEPLGSFCVIDSQPRVWTDEELANLADIAASVNAEIALREAVVVEREARKALERANNRLRFLTGASALLSRTLDREQILQDLARMAVPTLADWCMIDVADGGRLRRVALAHAGREREAVAQQLVGEYQPVPDAPVGAAKVFRTGEPELVAPVTPSWIRQKAQDERHAELLLAMGVDSIAFVPLTANDRLVGVMTFASNDPSRRYGAEDLDVFVELGRHAALAVENGRLYAERDNVARTLQRSLLPPSLPRIPGFDIAAAYAPSGTGNEVGGDFYDVFRNPWGDWVLVIGDVCGKGVEAAVVTGLARHTVRAAATDHRDPTEVLAILNQVLLDDPAAGGHDRFCTVLLGVLDASGDGACLAIASGGHPPPLVLRATGGIEEPQLHGSLLGLFEAVEFAPACVELEPGDLLLAYTDGVVEARADHELYGRTRLAALVEDLGPEGPEKVTTGVLQAVLEWQRGRTSDDVAMLALQRGGVAPGAADA